MFIEGVVLTNIFVAMFAVLASSGFWAYIIHKDTKTNALTELILGLAHDRISFLGSKYIRRGWICKEEYENLTVFLYKPYKKINGNGTLSRIMKQVEELDVKFEEEQQ